MKTSVTLIKKLARLGVLGTETIKYKRDNDITIENSDGENVRVLTDNVTDEDIPLMIAAEQLATLKSIRNMVKYFYVTALIGVGVWWFIWLATLGSEL